MKLRRLSPNTHLLHSRLQLIRDRLDSAPGMPPDQFLTRNQLLIDKAVGSVALHHSENCSRTDVFQACELFLSTITANERKIMQQPLYKKRVYFVEHLQNGVWSQVSEESTDTEKIRRHLYRVAAKDSNSYRMGSKEVT